MKRSFRPNEIHAYRMKRCKKGSHPVTEDTMIMTGMQGGQGREVRGGPGGAARQLHGAHVILQRSVGEISPGCRFNGHDCTGQDQSRRHGCPRRNLQQFTRVDE